MTRSDDFPVVDPSVFKAVHDEASEDLDRLIPAARKALAQLGPERAAVELASGLLTQPGWTRMMVSSVLGVALVRLVQQEAGAAP